jgi:hypothetical protein
MPDSHGGTTLASFHGVEGQLLRLTPALHDVSHHIGCRRAGGLAWTGPSQTHDGCRVQDRRALRCLRGIDRDGEPGRSTHSWPSAQGLEVFRDERIHYRIFHLAEGSMPPVVPSLDDAKTVASDSLQAWQDLDVAR